jgi:hypothetical protein
VHAGVEFNNNFLLYTVLLDRDNGYSHLQSFYFAICNSSFFKLNTKSYVSVTGSTPVIR